MKITKITMTVLTIICFSMFALGNECFLVIEKTSQNQSTLKKTQIQVAYSSDSQSELLSIEERIAETLHNEQPSTLGKLLVESYECKSSSKVSSQVAESLGVSVADIKQGVQSLYENRHICKSAKLTNNTQKNITSLEPKDNFCQYYIEMKIKNIPNNSGPGVYSGIGYIINETFSIF